MDAGAGPRAGAGDRRHQAMINGPEILHPRRQFHPRRGAGAARNFFVGAGFNAFGIACGRRRRLGAGGMGRRRRAADGPLGRRHPPLRPAAPRPALGAATARWRPMASTTPWPGPHEEYESGRPRVVSPLYERLKAAGRRASAPSSAGSGRTGSRRRACEPRDIYSLRPAELVRRRSASEHRAARERVALFDQSSFAKFELSRRATPRRRCPGSPPTTSRSRPGASIYTQMLNPRGGIECDLTVVAARRGQLLHRHRHRLPHPRLRLDPANISASGLDARLTDVTEAYRHARR